MILLSEFVIVFLASKNARFYKNFMYHNFAIEKNLNCSSAAIIILLLAASAASHAA